MTSERIKELHESTAYPQSRSVYQALLQVWNECEQENSVTKKELLEALQDILQLCKIRYSETDKEAFDKISKVYEVIKKATK